MKSAINHHALKTLLPSPTTSPPLIVFSHLPWNFVKQRPQHLIERIARYHQVLFIEEPVISAKHIRVKLDQPQENITVMKTRLTGRSYLPLVSIIEQRTPAFLQQPPLLWFYSPTFVELITALPASVTLYDCMDELSNFKDATTKMVEQEKRLLQKVDLVFTGGRSLYEVKSQIHSNCHCFPSSVESAHFAQALDAATPIPADIAEIPPPRIGYYGVIDERIDLSLLREVAGRLPKAAFIMIGPRAKISRTELPRNKNIYYLGQKQYAELPNYLKAFEIAMMPFALNKATKFISPTKTLEYMAALKPIISTPIRDVARQYPTEVAIATSAAEFVEKVKTFLAESAEQKHQRHTRQNRVIQQTSWDTTAASMEELIQVELTKKQANSWLREDNSPGHLTSASEVSLTTLR